MSLADYNIILSGLVLGSIDGLYSTTLTEFEQLDAVVSVTPLDETPIPGKYKHCHSRYPISFKMPTDEIVQIVKIVAEQLDEMLKNKKTVYIHCYEGVSRSAICVMYYLVKYHNYTKQDAFEFVKQQRPNVSPNDVMLKVYEEL
jgi:protein-tyrosine phosphatase